MKKMPWKQIGIICAVVALLVIGRCLVTVGRTLYYGGTAWTTKLLEDPWFYIGMVAAALCVAAFSVLAIRENKNSRCEG